MIVYLPILTLEGIEGKLFRPMALTVIFALIGSMILSLTLMPVLASLFLPQRSTNANRCPMRAGQADLSSRPAVRHAPPTGWSSCLPLTVLVLAFGMIAPQPGIGVRAAASEGAIAISVVRLAGTDLEESVR